MKTLLLRRETLTALDGADLAELRGGTAVTSQVTCFLGCATVSRTFLCVSVANCLTTVTEDVCPGS